MQLSPLVMIRMLMPVRIMTLPKIAPVSQTIDHATRIAGFVTITIFLASFMLAGTHLSRRYTNESGIL
jgi:hypothetical protein